MQAAAVSSTPDSERLRRTMADCQLRTFDVTSAAVIGCWLPLENTTPNRYSFQMPVNCQITVTMRIGGDSGSTILKKMRQNPAPSMRAAFIRSSGMLT